MTNAQTPLLPSDHTHISSQTQRNFTRARHQTKRFLTSKYGHYAVLVLVSIDVTSIFADLIAQLLTCEGRIPHKDGSTAQEVLGDLGLVFSCLFMLELLASVWAFGWQYVLKSFQTHCEADALA